MNKRLIIYGLAIWVAATVALRIFGQYMFHPGNWKGTVILFAITFPLIAYLVRGLCRDLKLRPEDWPAGAVSLLLPTLLLDPFSSAFFPLVFPNMSPDVAGVFGGLMLWCCAAGLVGVT